MVDTVPGDSGVFAASHVAVDCVPGHAPAPIPHPSMGAATVPSLDRIWSRRFATVKTAVKTNLNVMHVYVQCIYSVLVIANVILDITVGVIAAVQHRWGGPKIYACTKLPVLVFLRKYILVH